MNTSEALVTEPLAEKLSRLIPGAVARRRGGAPPERLWVVEQPRAKGAAEWNVLGTGSTEREAIDRAVFLYGSRR